MLQPNTDKNTSYQHLNETHTPDTIALRVSTWDVFCSCVFLGVFSPKRRPAAVIGPGSAHRVYERAGGAGRKPNHQPCTDQLHHLPPGSARYGWSVSLQQHHWCICPFMQGHIHKFDALCYVPVLMPDIIIYLFKTFMLLSRYSACDDSSREILHSSYNCTSTLASIIHHHSSSPGEPLVLQVSSFFYISVAIVPHFLSNALCD